MHAGTNRRRRGVLMLALLAVLVALAALAARTTVYAASVKPGLTLQVSPAGQSVERGSTATYTVTVSSTNGFAGPVTLGVDDLPSAATSAFAPATVTLTAGGPGSSATSTLTITTSPTTPVGASTITVTGVSGKVRGSVTAGLTVNYRLTGSLSMTATPSTVTLSQGSVGAVAVALTRSGVPGNVSLSVSGGLPAGATWAFSPSPTTGTSSTLQVSTSATTPEGTYTLYLVASGQDTTGATRYAYASVELVINTTVRTFTVSGDLNGALAPGVTLPLPLSVANPNKKPVSVTNLSVGVQGVTRTAWATSHGLACGPNDYAVTQYSGPYPLSVPGTSTQSLGQLGVPSSQWPRVTLLNRPTNQDGCKGATVTLTYSGSGQGN